MFDAKYNSKSFGTLITPLFNTKVGENGDKEIVESIKSNSLERTYHRSQKNPYSNFKMNYSPQQNANDDKNNFTRK